MQAGKPLVLVTGGSGYIAAHIVRQLLDTKEYRVRTTVRKVEKSTKTNHLYNWQAEVGAENLELVPGDLMKADGWDAAVAGADYVLHTASPFPLAQPKDEDELIKPAVNGTLFVLNAAKKVPSIKRVVITSSTASVFPGNEDLGKLNETHWADESKCDAYKKSKTLAEKAAWKFIEENKGSISFDLATINPGFVMGPSLTENLDYTSGTLIAGIFLGGLPGLPKEGYPCIDVRDVARAHLQAFRVKEAGGVRLILSEESYWIRELAQILVELYGSKGYDAIVTAEGGEQGKNSYYDNSKTRSILGFKFRPVRETLTDMVEGLMNRGVIPRK